MHDTLRWAEVQTQAGVLCWAVFWASFRCLIERDLARAGALADRAVALAAENGFGFWATAGQLSQGAALVIADPGRATMLIGAGLALCFQAEALLRLGRTAVDRALAMTASTDLSWWDAELHRIGAAVIRAEGRSKAAIREALARAVAIAEQQGSETFRRRAAADMHAT